MSSICLFQLLQLFAVGASCTNPRLQLAPTLQPVLDLTIAPFWNNTASVLENFREGVCYNEDERMIPVNIQSCLPVTRKMIRMRRSEQMRVFKGSNCPITITDYGTACTITLESDSFGDEDRFSFRAVALMAYSILEICERPGLGGRARFGNEGFSVRVDAVVPQPRGNPRFAR